MHTDHAVDDELQAGQAHAGVRQLREVEGAVRVADVHHDLERQIRHGIHGVLLDVEAQFAFEDVAGVAFSAGNGHALAVFQQLGGVAATDHRRDAQLAGDDRRVAGTAATVGDDGAGALHDRFPVRVGHVGDQHVAWLDLVHLGHVLDDADLAGADALADGATFHQHGAGFFQQVPFHDIRRGTALHGFRTGLNDIELAVVAVFGPLDVHRALVVLFDDHRLLGQFADFGVAQAETGAIGLIDVDGLDRLAGRGDFAVDHLDGLAAQVATQDGRTTSRQRALVDIELIRVHRALHDGFTQAVGAGDEHHVTEARLGIEGEHHAGGAGFGTDHALHAGRQGHQLVVEALVDAVGNGAVVEQRGEHLFGGANDVFDATDVQEGLLLTGEGSVRQVFGGSRRAHGHGHVRVAGRQRGERGADFGVEFLGELGFHDPLTDLRAGLGQGVHIVDVQGVERGMDLLVQAAQLQKITISLSCRGKATGHRYTGTGQVTDHLAQGCVLAPHMLYIMDAELIEGNYVLYQGDLSTNGVG
ncbi:hypothetical protein PS639_03855 [Pseudomonas fluorescens]|nr:hypothetical protein PS639_03855 [Pseudomonas fluorescens]